MYLDTDIILALIKDEDWLKKYVNIKKISSPKTSALNVIEARLVLLREYSRKEAINALKKINGHKIKIVEINENIINKSQELIEKYSELNMFDAVHVASVLINNEELLSTDSIFDKIKEVNKIDPRNMSIKDQQK